MRIYSLWLGFVLLAASSVFAQSNSLKACISQDGEGSDALRLAGELSSRKLKSGASVIVVATTGKGRSVGGERNLAQTQSRVALLDKTEKARAEIEQLRCDYNIKVFYHERLAEIFDANSPADIPGSVSATLGPQPNEDRTTVSYELRKAGSKKILARASAPPLTVYVRQGRRVFNPYSLFADQILKKLDSASSRSH